MQFIKNKLVGYNINLLAEMPQEGNMISKFELFKEQLLETGAVTSVNEASRSMTDAGNWFYGFEWSGMQKKGKEIVFNRLETQYDFVKTTVVSG